MNMTYLLQRETLICQHCKNKKFWKTFKENGKFDDIPV
jgi:hypothetical protein